MGKIKLAAVSAGVCAIASTIAPARAATVVSGSAYDGWIVTVSQGITLTEDTTNSQNLELTKNAAFSSMEGLLITFTEESTSAAPTITFQNETLTNNTGTTWGGFEFLLMNPLDSATFTTSANSPFLPASGYTLLPAAGSSTNVDYAGSQANLATSIWGLSPTLSDLSIAADPTGIGTTFVLKEIPLTSQFVTGLPGSTGSPIPPVAIPIPSALWQGLVGLASVALVGLARRRRRQPG
jgi:hypothetical protein